MTFKRATLRYGETPEPVTPYQKAAQVWDERIGSARAQAHNWRLMALGSLVLSLLLAGLLLWVGRSATTIPYIVEVDPKGGARAVGPAVESYTLNAPVRLVANDRKDTEGAPDFRIMSGMTEIGAAWRRTRKGTDEPYLSVKLDCPALPQPIWGALLEATDDAPARLVWRRDRRDDG